MYFSYTCMSQQSRGAIFEIVYRDTAYPCISLITHKLKKIIFYFQTRRKMPTIYHDPPGVSIYDNIHSTFFYNQNDNNVQK